MTRFIKARLLLLLFLLTGAGVFLFHSLNGNGTRPAELSPTGTREEDYAVEQSRLRASVHSLRWNKSGELSFRYRLQWTNTPKMPDDPIWLLKEDEPIGFPMWDRLGHVIPGDRFERVCLGEPFVHRQVRSVEIEVEIEVPEGARYFAVELGASGLDTPKIPVPMRP